MIIETTKIMKITNDDTKEIKAVSEFIKSLITEMKTKEIEVIENLSNGATIDVDDLMTATEVLLALSDKVIYFESVY